jgi:hypothetical protein
LALLFQSFSSYFLRVTRPISTRYQTHSGDYHLSPTAAKKMINTTHPGAIATPPKTRTWSKNLLQNLFDSLPPTGILGGLISEE